MEDNDFRDLQERVALIESMASTHGWEMLIDRSRATLLNRQTRVVQGRCASYEDYLKECSFMDGIEHVLTLPTRVRLELENAMAERVPDRDELDDEDE